MVVVVLGTKRTKDKGQRISFSFFWRSDSLAFWYSGAKRQKHGPQDHRTLLSCSKHPWKLSNVKHSGMDFPWILAIPPNPLVQALEYHQSLRCGSGDDNSLLSGRCWREPGKCFFANWVCTLRGTSCSFLQFVDYPTCTILYLLLWIGSIQCKYTHRCCSAK